MTRDRVVGLSLAAAGVGISLAAANYELGLLRNIGPGLFPILVASVLAALGVLVAMRPAADRLENTPAAWPAVRFGAVPFAVVAFALSVERAGILIAAIALIAISSCARAGGRWRDVALLSLVLSLLAVLIFVWALGVPLAIVPPRIGWR